MNVYVNKKCVEKLIDEESSRLSADEKELVNKMIEIYPIGATLSFDEDLLRLKYYSDPENKNSSEFFQQSGLKSNDLQMLAPNGKPLSYLSLNANLPKIMGLFKDNNEFENELQSLSDQLGLTKEDLLSLCNGKISFSLIDIKPGVEHTMEDGYTYQGSPNPVYMLHAGINNTNALQKILEKLQMENAIYDNGVYSILYDSYNQQYIHFMLKDDDFILSNSLENITDFRDGKSWSALKESSGADLVTKNPFSIYMDLKYDTYKDLIEKFGSSSEKELAKEILKNMVNIIGYSNPNETTVELKLKPQNTNSLWYILTIVEDVYKKVA